MVVFAHILGFPVEETAATFFPVATIALGVLAVRLRERRWSRRERSRHHPGRDA
jgi:hypothetical protein